MLAHHAQDSRPVLVPGRDVRLDGLVGQLVVRLDGRPIDRIEDRPLAPLEIRSPHSEGGHRIRDERRPRHERNFLPVNWCSLRSLQCPKVHKYVFNFWVSRGLSCGDGSVVRWCSWELLAVLGTQLGGGSIIYIHGFWAGHLYTASLGQWLGSSQAISNIRTSLHYDTSCISTRVSED